MAGSQSLHTHLHKIDNITIDKHLRVHQTVRRGRNESYLLKSVELP